MKTIVVVTMLSAIFGTTVAPALAQSVSKPLEGVSNAEVAAAVASGTTIPMWSYGMTSSRDGQIYSGMMVGASPFTDPSSTTVIPTQIVPLIIHMPDGRVFDPTMVHSCASAPDLARFQESPFFLDHAYTMNDVNVGTTQFLDAFQRANFWRVVDGQPYHTRLIPTTLSPISVNMPAGSASSYNMEIGAGGYCGYAGYIHDRETLDQIVRHTLLPQLAAQGLSPATFPIFLVSNIYFGNSPASYHGAFDSPTQTYAVVSYNSNTRNDDSGFSTSADRSHMAATNTFSGALALADWLNDPLGTNGTPAWGGIFTHPGCQSTLGIGDRRVPQLSAFGSPIIMPNGFTYRVPELPYFSWFLGGPSLAAGGRFSTKGLRGDALRGDARPCPPGGSNPTTLGDVDGNGRANLIWSDRQTGAVIVTETTEHFFRPLSIQHFENWFIASDVPLVWGIAGVGDVSGNGKADIVWRNSDNGDVAIWLMEKPISVEQTPVLARGVPLTWQIAGVGDVDGDRKADLVWRHTQNGDVAVWLLDGATVKQIPVVGSRVPLDWQIAGVGDLDGDGKADLVWRHTQNGDVAVWLMDGVTVKQAPVVGSRVPLAWQIVGLGDLDGDGKTDLVWRHMQNGDLAAWLMDGPAIKQAPIFASGPLAWQIIKVHDADGDGRADLIWRHRDSLVLVVWRMDGAVVKDELGTGTAPAHWSAH